MKTAYLIGVVAFLLAAAGCQSDRLAVDPLSANPSLSGARASTDPNQVMQQVTTTVIQQQLLTYINQARSHPCKCGATTYPAVLPLAMGCPTERGSREDYSRHGLNDYRTYANPTGLTNPVLGEIFDNVIREGYPLYSGHANQYFGLPTTAPSS